MCSFHLAPINGLRFSMLCRTPPSYLWVLHCPWNSGCNCFQRSLYQPGRYRRQNNFSKESVKRGQTWLAATFEKWCSQISVVLDFRVPCQHTGMVPPSKMCRNEHTKPIDAHTRKHTTSCAKPWRHNNPHSRLFKPNSQLFLFPPSSLLPVRFGMSTSVATLGCGRGPYLAPRHRLRTHAFQNKRAKMRALLAACDSGLDGIGCLAPISLKNGLSSWMFSTSPGVYFWVFPMPEELFLH